MEAGEILLTKGLLDERQLQTLREAHQNGARLDQVAVQLGFVSERDVLGALGEQLGIDFVDLTQAEVDLSLLAEFPPKLIHRHSIFPIRREAGRDRGRHQRPLRSLCAGRSGRRHRRDRPPGAGRRQRDRQARQDAPGRRQRDDRRPAGSAQEEGGVEVLDEIELDGSEDSQMAQEASVVRLVNEILVEAVEARASDIHIEVASRRA